MAIDTLLVPVDGSERSEQALQVALTMAQKFDSKAIHVQYIVDTNIYAEPALSSVELITDGVQEVAEELVGNIRERAGAQGIEVQTDVHHGRPKREIVEGAREIGADLIVMGETGHGAWRPIRRYVDKHSPCVVVVV